MYRAVLDLASIDDMEKKGIKKLAVLKKLSGTHWGANSKILKTVYMGAVRPSLEYGASAWATAAKTHTNKLDKVQNIGLRTILGAMKTTPIAEMEKQTGQSSEYRLEDNPWRHENHSHS